MTRPVYDTLGRLATGGMGTVELAVRRAEGFERLYALKRLHAHLREDPAFVAMFKDEARLAGLVRHANVASVLDVGEDDAGPFLAMEYIEGVSVADVLSAGGGDPPPMAMAITVAAQAARGLDAAHELQDHEGRPLGLVHRDVSPRNILIGFDGLVRVTDFGLAKALGNASRTTTGIVKGSLGYVSPEALRFETLDRRSDIFSLGVVLHEMLTGERLYPGGEGDAVRSVLDEPPPDLLEARSDAPAALQELLFEMLAKDPAQRPATAAAVAERLEAILHELIVIDGAFDLAGFMATAFADERKRRAELVTTGLGRLTARRRTQRFARRAGLVALGVCAVAGAALGGRALLNRQGLRGEYFDDPALTQRRLVRTDREVAFDWGTDSPDPRIARGTFAVRWTGAISAPSAGERMLCLVSDDGVRLWFDDRLVIDRWLQQWPTQSCGAVRFAAPHRHKLRIDYVQYDGLAYVRLFWNEPGRPYTQVPPEYLHLDADSPP